MQLTKMLQKNLNKLINDLRGFHVFMHVDIFSFFLYAGDLIPSARQAAVSGASYWFCNTSLTSQRVI